MSKCGSERKNIDIDSLNERVRKAGMKLTQQRTQMLKILLAHPDPISADEIFKKFDDKSDGMDLVTIYRILKKFEEAGIVSRLEFGDGVARFELALESGHHHHHVICRQCQRVEPIHICDLDPHIKMVETMGYKQVSHRLDFFGVCSRCQ
ncbi:Fur family transcriptional regulator [Bdellovibrio sp. HCB117]|uniref:Ferric uptake regulator-like protein n=1 Tax=Bdellovibrio bacteriovorus TaxID=959 RepID=A0A150WC90_BDEBC|nr:Fur family transcriptional regulator [Bdellovibrio bacteriovorus]KYG60478.1 ferric uptake regulator-like protein [Bdellovibrio bacteriovorus]